MNKRDKNPPILTLEDLASAVYAMDSWVDAFQYEEEFQKDVPRVKKAIDNCTWILQEAGFWKKEEHKSYLRLVSPKKED